MALSLTADASTGHAAGDAAAALAVGNVQAGTVAVVSGAEPQPGNGILVEVSLSVDDTGGNSEPNPGEIGTGHTFTVTQALGPALTFTTQSTPRGFTLTPTGTVNPNAMYVFTWTG